MDVKKFKINRLIENLTFGNAIYRGVMALALGIVLIIYPTKTEGRLINIMGWFWLGSGFALLRHPVTERTVGKPMSRGIGLVAMITGLLVITRDITSGWVPEIAMVEVLGVAILITGVVHMFGQYRLGKLFKRKEETLDFMLGIYEVVLGLMLISSPLNHGPITYWIVTFWALIFGNMVIANAFSQRLKKASEAEEFPGQQDQPESVPADDKG
jgi:uncharacterized membrane protein HdeD (DUF308 family)